MLSGSLAFMAFMKLGLMPSLAACVLPFLPGDAVKIAVTALIAPRVRAALQNAR